ncbi:hypothetical protein [Sphaerisporangium rhizosphaerae]|uniref:DUF3027 domain-containing protein n=1 Tax=Sphaerisporangium rhizosphaerae TaxID=2269375 RepID=A0ABW2P744_9ACTN
MSKTDKTRPWWVRIADAPMVTCRAVHDHRFGPCTLPDEITAATVDLDNRTGGCHWRAGIYFWVCYGGDDGSREWAYFRRQERRRDRRQARRELRAYRGED